MSRNEQLTREAERLDETLRNLIYRQHAFTGAALRKAMRVHSRNASRCYRRLMAWN